MRRVTNKDQVGERQDAVKTSCDNCFAMLVTVPGGHNVTTVCDEKLNFLTCAACKSVYYCGKVTEISEAI